jgi:hypothetical protein
MYVFIVSVLCAAMLAAARQMAYDNLLENIVVGILLFVAIDSGLRAVMDKPSWMLALVKKKR